jgi:branched-chain amino acid transport system permease protein
MSNTESGSGLNLRLKNVLNSPAGICITLAIMAALLAAIDKGPYVVVNAVVTGGMWALMAMGLALVFGVMNITSFVHGEFFMIGGLVAYFVFTPFVDLTLENPNSPAAALLPLLPLTVSFLGGILMGVICEYLVFRPLRRRSREQWVMNTFVMTLGMSVFVVNTVQFIFGTDFRGIVNYWNYSPLSMFGVYISFDRLFVFVLAMLVILVFFLVMKFAQIGRAIRAVSQCERGALMVGVDIDNIQVLTLGLSCGFAALAGASLLFMFPAYPTVGLGPLYNSWFVVILAGMGNVGGAAAGGFIVALLQILTTVYVGEGWDYTIPTAFMICILIFIPSGIFGSKVRGILDQ